MITLIIYLPIQILPDESTFASFNLVSFRSDSKVNSFLEDKSETLLFPSQFTRMKS